MRKAGSIKGATRLIERDRPVITTELKEDMLAQVSKMSLDEYLGYFEGLGYAASVLEKSGAQRSFPTMAALLADWEDRGELRDLLLVPSAALGAGGPAPGPGSAPDRVEQFVGVFRDHEAVHLSGPDETLLHGMAEEGQQVVEEPVAR